MSECVVRMEMPNECPCELWHNCNPYIKYSMTILDASMERFPRPKPLCKGCRIICQLPEGHGRLADKDLLMQDLDFLNTFGTPDDGKELSYEDILVTIDDFPTIVPAERSEHEAD